MNGLFVLKINYTKKLRERMEKDDCFFSHLAAMLIVLSVYLVPFAPSLSIGEALLAISMVGLLIKFRKVCVYKNLALFLYVLYGLFMSLFIAIIYETDISQTLNRLLRDGFYWILIYVIGYSFLKYGVYKKWVKILCVCLSIYILVQFAIYMIMGYMIPGFFLNAVVSKSSSALDIYQHTLEWSRRNGYLKATGFLTEGAHAAQTLAIGMIVVFDFDNPQKTERRTLGLVILFSFASVLTFSATGVAMTGFVWVAIICSLVRGRKMNKKIGVPIIIIMLTIILFFLVFGDKLLLSSVVDRILFALSESSADGSSFYRLYRGFVFWRGLPIINKLCGIGFGNIESLYYLSTGAVSSEFMNNEYMNTFSYILTSSGVIGSFLFILYTMKMYGKANKTGKVMIMLLLLMSLSSSPYNSVYWVWMVLVIICGKKGESCNEK